jgi:dihydroorotate dehydrogenase
MYRFIKIILFNLAPEVAHGLAIKGIKFLGQLHKNRIWPRPRWSMAPELRTRSPFGILDSPVGLAAGLDKNGEALWGWQALGFGFVEVGTITPREQPGNEKPRLFRFPQWKAIVNRMGFNNDGAFKIAQRIRLAREQGLTIKVGANIGKNFNTPLNQAAEDYRKVTMLLQPHVDYLVINVSSPNTPGLRSMQKAEFLEPIVEAVRREAPLTPLFIKVAPDQAKDYAEGIISVCKKHKLTGVICGNTLANHAASAELSEHDVIKLPQGGLSGAPIFNLNLKLVNIYKSHSPDTLVIGVGGITTAESALAYKKAGCDLIQIYSGFIFNGPRLLKEILKAWNKAE